MWLLELTQGFSKIWPTDLVFHPSWPIFKLVRDIIRANILSNFQEYWTENMASRAYTTFFLDLTWWPCFWFNMAHFHTISRYIHDKHSDHFSRVLDWKWGLYSVQKVFLRFDLVTYFLTPHDPISILIQILSRQTFWPCFTSIWLKMWPLQHTQGFSKIWPSDLVFDPTWPNFTLVRDFIKTNIQTNFHKYLTENVASRAYTRFF